MRKNNCPLSGLAPSRDSGDLVQVERYSLGIESIYPLLDWLTCIFMLLQYTDLWNLGYELRSRLHL